MAEEKRYENKIKSYLKSKGCYCYKAMGNAFTTSGTPDLLTCVNGYFLAIEVKAQTGKPSDLQMVKVDQIRKAGGLAYVAYPSGWYKIKGIIDDLLNDKFNKLDEVILK